MVEQWSPKPKVKGSNPFSPDASWKQTAVTLSKATGTIPWYSYYFRVWVFNQLKINTELVFLWCRSSERSVFLGGSCSTRSI